MKPLTLSYHIEHLRTPARRSRLHHLTIRPFLPHQLYHITLSSHHRITASSHHGTTMFSRTSVRVDIETGTEQSTHQQLQAQIHALAARVNELERRRLEDLQKKYEDIERKLGRDWNVLEDALIKFEAAACEADRTLLKTRLDALSREWKESEKEWDEAFRAMQRQKRVVRAGERQQAEEEPQQAGHH